MNADIICAIIAGLATVVTSLVGINVSNTNKKIDRRAEVRNRESLLSLRMMDATLQLSVVTSNALTGGHNNGNVERAKKAAQKVAKDYEEFMMETTAHEISR